MNGNGKKLSTREIELITLASQGATDYAIAHKLGIALGTVATYWTRIRMKLGRFNRVELVARYVRERDEAAVAELLAENQRLKGTVEHVGDVGPQESGFFRAVLEESPDVVLLVDDANKIAFANHAAQRFLGYSEEEFMGLELQALVPGRYHGIHGKHVAEYRRNPTSRKMGEHKAVLARKKAGTEVFISAALSTVSVADHQWVICSIQRTLPLIGGEGASEQQQTQAERAR